jgi:transposase, IS5 family
MIQFTLFNEEDRVARLNKLNNPLEKFKTIIEWEIFREDLESMYKNENGKGGRPPYDPVIMFKIIFLQRLYNLSDEQMEFHLVDRLSFQRFLGLETGDKLPDAKTIWIFKERIKEEKLHDVLFQKLNYWLNKKGKILKEGSIIDGTIVEAPIQRNTREENEQIKNDETPEEWKNNPNKLYWKDVDARWKQKNGKNYYGYEQHVVVDKDSKLIKDFEVTDASVHDSQPAPELIDRIPDNSELYGDSAYHSDEIRDAIKEKNLIAKICSKGNRSKPLTEEDKIQNNKISKIRSRAEHVFADIKSFGGDFLRTIGIERAKVQLTLVAITYNIRRYKFLQGA